MRAPWFCGDLPRHLAIAAPDQYVGHRLAKRRPPRDRVQMRLTFGLGEIDEIGLLQALRQLEHGAGDGDVVVMRQRPQHLGRRVGEWRQIAGQRGARFGLDFRDEQAEDVVE